jgi:hypothetical protein
MLYLQQFLYRRQQFAVFHALHRIHRPIWKDLPLTGNYQSPEKSYINFYISLNL